MRKGGGGLISKCATAGASFMVSLFSEHKSVGDFSIFTASREHRAQINVNVVSSLFCS